MLRLDEQLSAMREKSGSGSTRGVRIMCPNRGEQVTMGICAEPGADEASLRLIRGRTIGEGLRVESIQVAVKIGHEGISARIEHRKMEEEVLLHRFVDLLCGVAGVESALHPLDAFFIRVFGRESRGVELQRFAYFVDLSNVLAACAALERHFEFGFGPYIGAVTGTSFQNAGVDETSDRFTDGIPTRAELIYEVVFTRNLGSHGPYALGDALPELSGDPHRERDISLGGGER